MLESEGSFLFILNTYNDIDHIAPLIWKCSDEKRRALVLFSRNYDWHNDYRISFLSESPYVEVCQLPWANAQNLAGRAYRRVRYGDRFAKNFLSRNRVVACVTEWYRPSRDLRGRLLGAAKRMGIKCFAVPHGCNVHLNYNSKHAEIKRNVAAIGRWSDLSEMNVCDRFVVDTQFNRQMYLDGGIDPAKCGVWGSTRFSPEWVKINSSICPRFEFCKGSGSKETLRVALFLPHWRNNVDEGATLSLIEALAATRTIQIAIKAHTRGNGEFPPRHRQAFESLNNVAIVDTTHSPSLILWSDAVINFGSSIGLDAVVQRKPLIYPGYLHGNTTIYDESDACFKPRTEKEILDLLEAIRLGTAELPAFSEEDFLFRNVIYGGNEPFDVLNSYYANICQESSAYVPHAAE